MELLLATHNAHKTREFAGILGSEFRIRDLSGLAIPPIAETGRTFAENATLKALVASKEGAELVVADDSGLEVDALKGAPGIFSARYAGANATDCENVEKLLREIAHKRDRTARFRCVIALARAGELLRTFEGTVEGVIVDLARGSNGFGYDPVFQPTGFDKTFGELPAKIKNEISHRVRAIAPLKAFLRTLRD